MKKGIFTSNLSSTSAKIDGTEGFKKYCAGYSKPLRGATRGPRATGCHGLANVPGLTRPKLMLQTKNSRNFRTSGGSLNFN